LVATFLVAFLPLIVASAVQDLVGLRSALLAIPVAVLFSLVTANGASAYWMRREGSKELVFAGLMIWSWLRRWRTERRLDEAKELLGLIGVVDVPTLSPDRRAELLKRLAAALEAGDPYTHGHSRRVTRHAYMIAKKLKLPKAEAARVRAAAALHDVGKINTPPAILNKPDRLTDEEFAVVKRHPVDGAEMVSEIGDDELTEMVRHHHERLDGKGYPHGLAGGEIPLGARIIAVADTFDAITSRRPYRGTRKHREAIDVLKRESGTQLDAAAVSAFLDYYSGRRGLAVWALVNAAPQRLFGWLGGPFQAAGAAAPITKGVAVLGAAAAIGGSVASPALETISAASKPSPAGQAVTAASEHGQRPGSAASGQRGDARGSETGRDARDGRSRRPGARKPGSGSKQTHPGAPGSGSQTGHGQGGPPEGAGGGKGTNSGNGNGGNGSVAKPQQGSKPDSPGAPSADRPAQAPPAPQRPDAGGGSGGGGSAAAPAQPTVPQPATGKPDGAGGKAAAGGGS
jgi:putative nucleotidyltransferase with HDIG domain